MQMGFKQVVQGIADGDQMFRRLSYTNFIINFRVSSNMYSLSILKWAAVTGEFIGRHCRTRRMEEVVQDSSSGGILTSERKGFRETRTSQLRKDAAILMNSSSPFHLFHFQCGHEAFVHRLKLVLCRY